MASQQPPARPWFRLATMAARSAPVPTPAPQPDPVPQPRPTVIRPAFRATTLPTQTQEPAPVATPAPPVATTQVPLTSAAPVTGSAPTAPAPAPATLQQTPSVAAPPPPPSPNTTVAPAAATSKTSPPAAAPRPPPSTTQLPATTTKSSPPTLFAVSATPKASPPPSVLPESLKQKLSSPSPPPKYSPAPRAVSQAQTSPPKPSPYQAATFKDPATASTLSSKPINYQQNSPSPSPNNRRILHPPSPLILPPSQLKSDNIQELNIPPEVEQKSVLVQETKEIPKHTSNNSNNVHLPRYTNEPPYSNKPHKGERHATKSNHHKDKGKYKNNSDSDGSGMRIVTIAGDNKGAIMELMSSRKKHEFGSKFRTRGEGEKSASDSSSSSSSEEGKSKKKENGERTMTKALSLPYVNSNVQGVNNSILLNATCVHNDPGVHISLSRTAAGSGQGFRVKKHIAKDD